MDRSRDVRSVVIGVVAVQQSCCFFVIVVVVFVVAAAIAAIVSRRRRRHRHRCRRYIGRSVLRLLPSTVVILLHTTTS